MSTGLLLCGCGGRADSGSPISIEQVNDLPSMQMIRIDPTLKGQRFSVLLNFELPSDDAFVSCAGGSLAIDSKRSLTGRQSLRVENGTHRVDVKLASLLVGRPFPAAWTLIGTSIYVDKPMTAAMTLSLAGGQSLRQKAQLLPGGWNAVWIDLTKLPATATPEALTLEFEGRSDAWIDDLMLTDNNFWYVGQKESDTPWSIRRRGFVITVQSPGKFKADLDSQLSKPTGFIVDETCPMRARFSSAGDVKFLTIYADGRSYWDGGFRGLSAEARSEPAEQHAAPAGVAVPEEQGRVNRRTPGDANNDGYNERLGAYQITAGAARIDVTITPRSAAVYRPVLEIAGLPAGAALVTVEGRLVDTHVRPSDDRLLIQLPFRIDRPTTVNVRVTP